MVVRLSATGHLYPQEMLLVLILLEAETTPGSLCGRNLQLASRRLNQLRQLVPLEING